MRFSTTLLVALSALAAAQQSSNAVVGSYCSTAIQITKSFAKIPKENPATGYLGQTNADGAVTGQPDPATSQHAAITSQEPAATSQQPAASFPASGSTALIPTQTGASTMVISPQGSNGVSASVTPTSTSTRTRIDHTSPTDDSDLHYSSLRPSSSPSTGAAAIPNAAPAGLTVGLAGVALAAFL